MRIVVWPEEVDLAVPWDSIPPPDYRILACHFYWEREICRLTHGLEKEGSDVSYDEELGRPFLTNKGVGFAACKVDYPT